MSAPLRWAAFVVLVAGAVFAATNEPDAESQPAVVQEITRIQHPEVRVKEVEAAGERAGLNSVMAVNGFFQKAMHSGPTGDNLRVVFPKPARLYGVLVSVDLGSESMAVIEATAGLSSTNPYGLVADPDRPVGQEGQEGQVYEQAGNVAWLIHTSSTDGADIDQQVMFPKPIDVEAGEFVSLWVWFRNEAKIDQYVYPEMILYYEWI